MNNDLGQRAEPPDHEFASTRLTGADRREFLSSVGHEIRGPLSSIITHAEVLCDGVYGRLDDTQTAVLKSIQGSAKETLRLISDWIELETLEAGQPATHPTSCLVVEACEQCIGELRNGARLCETSLVLDVQPRNLRVSADLNQLKQLITGLVSAAALTVRTTGQIQLCITHLGDVLQMTASGPLENSTQLRPLDHLRKSNPIGLAMMQKLVAIQGGTLDFDAPSDSSFRWLLSLPLKIPSAEEFRPPALSSPGVKAAPTGSGGALTILLADDQPELVSVVSHYLEALGFQIIVAKNGKEAVEQVCLYHPQLVLMDIRMPVLDGLEAIRQIRASEDLAVRAVPIVSLSGLVGVKEKEKCLAAGANAYLIKPFGVKELDSIIKEFVKLPRQGNEAARH